jgi:hypothetical protein
MKSIFEPATKAEIKERVEKISNTTKPAWGKMNSAQMLAHCVKGLQSPLGEHNLTPPPFFIRWIGPLFKSQAVKPGIFGKNSPTAKELIISDERTFASEKNLLFENLGKFTGPESIKADKHVFFGKLSKEDWGKFLYKHLDHHLTQFGV